ncbi:polyhydroxybutyrate depolymerase [Frankia sp. EI5c]|uniref:PHB depolymerase family esterase n=1 Tax=Frankia sp. EI5c TaxID=683316 RepID=UPI0007C20444|nr:PHB depolymerase family esterase [Frankia sp. EI5c]OAA25646.1 polyhydroxybutyrate depolymerase [Frankia sp. EI5c]
MWFGWSVASNPLAGWWGKNKKKAIIIGVALVAVWWLAAGRGHPEVERTAIPDGYPSAGREVLVQAPSDPDDPLPLVIILHDGNSDVETLERESKASSLANRRDLALAFPEAVAGTWRLDDPNGSDLQYLRDVVRFMDEKRTDVDPDRVYVWGVGEGARLALLAACGTGTPTFAAVGVVGQFETEPGPTCDSVTPHGRVAETKWDGDVTDALWKFSRDLRRTA